jgi:hypothetical protein
VRSCLYAGHIRHRRFQPRVNDFRYKIFLMFIDLAELPQLFDRYWGWSARRFALGWFRRADFLGDPAIPLDEAVRQRVAEHFGVRPQGPIRMLAHLRYFGYNFNPVAFYFVYDAQDQAVEYVVAEITNTPWDERHAYVLRTQDAEDAGARVKRWQFNKAFHVSPFLPMDMRYDWRFTEPREQLAVHMENTQNGQRIFDATLTLRQVPLSQYALGRALLGFPLMTLRVSLLIYWQAFKLLLKRTPFFTHPDKLTP